MSVWLLLVETIKIEHLLLGNVTNKKELMTCKLTTKQFRIRTYSARSLNSERFSLLPPTIVSPITFNAQRRASEHDIETSWSNQCFLNPCKQLFLYGISPYANQRILGILIISRRL